MTIAQLKEELQTRNLQVKGISCKKKDWFLEQLGIGTELQNSAEHKEKNAQEAIERKAKADAASTVFHWRHCRYHAHPLAESCRLQAPKTMKNSWCVPARVNFRSQVGQCDVEHEQICTGNAFRSCERCDWDICETCHNIELLPTEEERLAELTRQQQVVIDRRTGRQQMRRSTDNGKGQKKKGARERRFAESCKGKKKKSEREKRSKSCGSSLCTFANPTANTSKGSQTTIRGLGKV
ncbi:expressed unknown protein [Seminavis robusta]|uniref:Uncharacterized protein n=1 Tax=Seminavis robusta TaxID=568900 RepID=A0A9N8E0K4_9STRA|nr:expressed unknown protein [Seminavis robusta]|eukprot:Sro415_g138490.1 n/a (238) ;mRNA; f:19594-20307